MSTREACMSALSKIHDLDLERVLLFLEEVLDERTPNGETLAAIAEVEEMKKHPERYKTYTDVGLMFKELLA